MEVNGYKIDSYANLTSANLFSADLTAEKLNGATMPDETIHK